MANKINVELIDLQSLVVSPTLLSRTDVHTTRLDAHDLSLNSIFSTAANKAGAIFTGDVTVQGTFTTTGTYADVHNLDISDNLIGLNRGITTRDANRDSGILIERGDVDNVFMGFDESAEKFTMGTTTTLPSHSGSMQNFTTGTLVANTEGTHTGNVSVENSTLTTSTTQNKDIVEGVGSTLNLSSTDLSVNNLEASDLSVNTLTTALFTPNLIDISDGTLTTSIAQDLAIFKRGAANNNANLSIGAFSLTANSFVGALNGTVGATTPTLGTFTGVALNTHVCHKSQSFNISGDIRGYPDTVADISINPNVVIGNSNGPQLLDITGIASPTHILIKNAYVNLINKSSHQNGIHDAMLILGANGGLADNTTLLTQGISNKEILGSNINIVTGASQYQVFINSPVITEIANSRLYFINKTSYTANDVTGNAVLPVEMTVVLDYDLLKL